MDRRHTLLFDALRPYAAAETWRSAAISQANAPPAIRAATAPLAFQRSSAGRRTSSLRFLQSYRAKERDNQVMQSVASSLSDDEMAALAEYSRCTETWRLSVACEPGSRHRDAKTGPTTTP